MPDAVNTAAIDAAIESAGSAKGGSPDVVTLTAAEFAKLHERSQGYEGLEKATASSLVERDLATTLGGFRLVPGVAPMVTKLLREELVATRDKDGWKVAARDGRSVAEFVNERFKSPEMKVFLEATSRGGAGARGNTATPTVFAGEGGYASLGDEMIALNIGRGIGAPAFTHKYRR